MQSKPIQQRASFEIIRYASCWEDADILVEALDIQPESQCLSIASGGDNAFAMLSKGPTKVTAVDLSLPQIAVGELKKSCFDKLDYDQKAEILSKVVRDSKSMARDYIFQDWLNEKKNK